MNRSSRCNRKRNAITLVEVVVALVLLATLVVGMISAYAAHHRQALLATRRQDAVRAADRLLSRWYAAADPAIPRGEHGTLSGPSGYVWRTEVVHQNMIEELPVEVIRLQVFSGSVLTQSGRFSDVKSSSRMEPLAQVDVIQPIPEARY